MFIIILFYINILLQQGRNMRSQTKAQQKGKYFQFIYEHQLWQRVKPSIEKMAAKTISASQIIHNLKEYDFLGNTVRKQHSEGKFNYYYLNKLYEKELGEIFSNMASLILEYENKQRPKIPFFYAGKSQQYTFKKKQILLLSSMMAMNLILSQTHSNQRSFKFPYPYTFKYIFSEEEQKTKGVIKYLQREFQQLKKEQKNSNSKYQAKRLTLKRLVLDHSSFAMNEKISFDKIVKQSPQRQMIKPTITGDQASIEDYYGKIKVDFANKFIGGGALHSGCVQQQIMFLNHPEMYTSVLFCEMMEKNQAIEFVGYEKYFKNKGYGYDTKFDCEQNHKYDYDEKGRAKQYIVAIDALHYPSKKHIKQFDMNQINREILKAYVGFSQSSKQIDQIVTGNWGCGAFNGNISLKFYIQWFAASLAGKKMIYTPFGAGKKLKQHQKLHQRISCLTVQQFYDLLKKHPDQLQKIRDINQYLEEHLKNADKLN